MNLSADEPDLTKLGWVKRGWTAVLARLAVIVIGLAVIFPETTTSIVHAWWVSETFTHGLVVLPLFAYLVWRKRSELQHCDLTPVILPLLLTVVLGASWLLGRVAGVVVLEQLSMVAMGIVVLWSLIGHSAASVLLFPLAFLMFAAPAGEELVPVLMELTATLTVSAVKFTGIPIYREGLFFMLPTGNWSVVEACSGIRYLIASMMLGSLFAYLSLYTLPSRVTFIALSLFVPLLANSARAFLIVMIGHFSGMKAATGVDHLVYGGVFFGVIMFVLFSLGVWMANRQRGIRVAERSSSLVPERNAHRPGAARWRRQLIVVLLSCTIWPVYAHLMNRVDSITLMPSVSLGTLVERLPPGWILLGEADTNTDWKPEYAGYDEWLTQTYQSPSGSLLRLDVLNYHNQKQGKELVSSENNTVSAGNQRWQRLSSDPRRQVFGSVDTRFREEFIRSTSQRLLLWQWHWIDGQALTSAPRMKWLEARSRLLLRNNSSAAIFISIDADTSDAREMMSTLAESLMPMLPTLAP